MKEVNYGSYGLFSFCLSFRLDNGKCEVSLAVF